MYKVFNMFYKVQKLMTNIILLAWIHFEILKIETEKLTYVLTASKNNTEYIVFKMMWGFFSFKSNFENKSKITI